jgi:hypothetical protein
MSAGPKLTRAQITETDAIVRSAAMPALQRIADALGISLAEAALHLGDVAFTAAADICPQAASDAARATATLIDPRTHPHTRAAAHDVHRGAALTLARKVRLGLAQVAGRA